MPMQFGITVLFHMQLTELLALFGQELVQTNLE